MKLRLNQLARNRYIIERTSLFGWVCARNKFLKIRCKLNEPRPNNSDVTPFIFDNLHEAEIWYNFYVKLSAMKRDRKIISVIDLEDKAEVFVEVL